MTIIHGRQDVPRPTFSSPIPIPSSPDGTQPRPPATGNNDNTLSTTEVALIGLVTFAVCSIVSLALYLYRGYLNRRQEQAAREEDARRRRRRAAERALRGIKTGPGWDVRPEMSETLMGFVESDPKMKTKFDQMMVSHHFRFTC